LLVLSKKSISISLLFLLTSCTINQQNVDLWTLKQIRDGRITLYDINNDKVQDLIVSGYQKGGRNDIKKTLFVETDLKSIETDTGKWEGKGYSFYLDREYKLWVRIKGKAEPVRGNYISNISVVLREENNQLEVLYNSKKQEIKNNTWEMPGLKLWVDKNNRLWIDEGGEKTISRNGKWKRRLNVLVNPLGEFIKGTGYKRGGKIDDERIPIGDSVIAIDGKTQKIFWTFQTYNSVTTYPSISEDKVFFGSHDKNFYAVNLKTGKLAWKFSTYAPINTTASIYNDIVYFGNSDGSFYALSARSGRLIWRFKTTGGIDSSPAVYKDKVFFGSWNKSFYALDSRNGRLIWKQDLLSYIGQSSPIVYEDKVIFGSWDKNIYAFNINNGRTEWVVRTDDWIDKASPAAGNGLIYIGNKAGNFYAIDPDNGDIRWEFNASDSIASSPVVTKNRVYVTSRDGYLYALSSKKGEKIWEHRTRFKIFGSPAVSANRVYISSMGGYLYSIVDTYMGKPSWAMSGGEPTHRNNINSALSYSKKLVAEKTQLDKFLEENNIRKLD
jgi:outer membrane protein assembly factor BamB